VHLGEAPLPRFQGGWSYGDLHYHSQGTDNEGESAYNYRGAANAMAALGIDFLWATEHASASQQIVDVDIEASYLTELRARATRGVLRDMDSRRFKENTGYVAQANLEAALRAQTSPGTSMIYNHVVPQIWLGGELDVIPETSDLAHTKIPFGAGRFFDVDKSLCGGWKPELATCQGSISEVRSCDVRAVRTTTCDVNNLWVTAEDGTNLIRDVQGLNDFDFGRDHMVYLPDPSPPAGRDLFVPSYTGDYGGASRRLADTMPMIDPRTGERVKGVLSEVEEKGGSVFLAHHWNAPSEGSVGPNGPPWTPSMLDKAFRSSAVLGLEFWNEDMRRVSTAPAPGLPGTTSAVREVGFERADDFHGHPLELIEGTRGGLRSDGNGKFELSPFDTLTGRYSRGVDDNDVQLNDGAVSWDQMNLRGLDTRLTSTIRWLPTGQPRKVLMAGGSDAHGDLNYQRVGYMTGTGSVLDSAIAKPSNLVLSGPPETQLAPNTRKVNSPRQVLSALRAGHFSVTDGPALRLVYDTNRNGIVDATDPLMGDTVDVAGASTLPVLVEWLTTPEFGGMESIELTVGVINSGTGASRLYAGGDGPLAYQYNLTETYSEGGWTYGLDPRGYWHATPPESTTSPYSMRISLPNGSCSAPCLAGAQAFTVDLTKLVAARGVQGNRAFVRAFAKTKNRATAADNAETLNGSACQRADSEARQSGRCIQRYAYTNPVWAVEASAPRNKDRRSASTPRGRRVDVASPWNDAANASVALFPSTGTAFADPTQLSRRDGGWQDVWDWHSGDFDGDGKADLVGIWNNNGSVLTVRRSDGVGLRQEHWSTAGFPYDQWNEWVPGDYDGDGKDDMMAIWRDQGSASFTFFRSTGTGFAAPVTVATRDGGWGATIKWVSGDFDGKGKDELLGMWNDNGQNTLTMRRLEGGRFTQSHWGVRMGGWNDSTRWLAGDYNGDGKSDVAAVWNDGGQASFAVFPSNGQAFPSYSQWAVRNGGWGDTVHWSSGDYDGDGKDDLLGAWNNGGMTTLTVRRSTGSGFQQQHWSVNKTGWADSTRWCSGSFR